MNTFEKEKLLNQSLNESSLKDYQLKEKDKEIERLKGLIFSMYSKGIDKRYGYDWEQFKSKNEL
jgi:hypothetical protein